MPDSPDRVRAAVIGCGSIGSGYDADLADRHVYTHAKAYLLNSDVDLVAACDVSPERRETFRRKWGEGISVFDSVSQLLAEVPDLGLVSICTPTASHYDDLLTVLESGVPHVLCEKPMTQTFDQAVEIARRYTARRTSLCVNHVLRWEPGVLEISRRLSAADRVVQAVNVVYAKGLMHNGLHPLDLTLRLFGEPMSVAKWTEFDEVPGDPTSSFVLTYPRFAVSFTGLREAHYSVFEYTIFLDNEKIVIDDVTTRATAYPVIDSVFPVGYSVLSNQPESLLCDQDRNMAHVVNDLVRGIRSNDRELFRCTASEALVTMDWLRRIRESPCLAG